MHPDGFKPRSNPRGFRAKKVNRDLSKRDRRFLNGAQRRVFLSLLLLDALGDEAYHLVNRVHAGSDATLDAQSFEQRLPL